MSRRLARRLASLVLLTTLVVGGGGVSLLDIALFHMGSAQHVRNLAATDAPRTTHHACVLGVSLPATLPSRMVPAPTAAVQVAVVPSARRPEAPLTGAAVRSPQQPRAPPAPLV